MQSDPGLLGAAQRLAEACQHVGSLPDTPQEVYYEWCAALNALRAEIYKTADAAEQRAIDMRLNADDGFAWLTAYIEAGFTRTEAMGILVATIARAPEPTA